MPDRFKVTPYQAAIESSICWSKDINFYTNIETVLYLSLSIKGFPVSQALECLSVIIQFFSEIIKRLHRFHDTTYLLAYRWLLVQQRTFA